MSLAYMTFSGSGFEKIVKIARSADFPEIENWNWNLALKLKIEIENWKFSPTEVKQSYSPKYLH